MCTTNSRPLQSISSALLHIFLTIWSSLCSLIALFLGNKINWNKEHWMYHHSFIPFNDLLLYLQHNDNFRDRNMLLKFFHLEEFSQSECFVDFSNPIINSISLNSSTQSAILLSAMLGSSDPHQYGIYTIPILINLYPDIIM